MNSRQTTQGHLSAFFTISIWGTTFISIKVLLAEFSPVEILFYRLVFGFIVLLLASPRFSWPGDWREELRYVAAGLCGVTLYFLFQNTALTYTLASNVSVLISVSPFFIALLSYFFAKEEALRPAFFIGFAVSILGIILISFNGNVILKLNPLGDLLAILSAVVWALYSVLMKKISARPQGLVQSTRKVFFYGFLFLIPALALSDFRLGLDRLASPANLLNLLFLGVGASALCFMTWNYAVSVLGAVKTGVYIYLVPIVTIAASALLLREPVTPVALLGVGLILAGLYVSERRRG